MTVTDAMGQPYQHDEPPTFSSASDSSQGGDVVPERQRLGLGGSGGFADEFGPAQGGLGRPRQGPSATDTEG